MSKEKFIARDRDCPKRKCFVPFRGNGKSICRLYELGRRPPQEERKKKSDMAREAKARLIAAAPDLLAACEKALAHLQVLHPLTGDEDFAYLEQAIAKVKGES